MVGDLTLVAIAVALAAAFVVLFARNAPGDASAWAVRRLLPGVLGLVALTGVAAVLLDRVAAADIAACEAAANTYDCEDAWLIVAAAILTGLMAIVAYVLGLTGVFIARRFRQSGAQA